MYFPLNNKRSNDGNDDFETKMNETMNETMENANRTENQLERERKSLPDFEIDQHLRGTDITAGDFYDSLEDNFES